MHDPIGLTVYNPSSLSDDDFLRGFVARQNVANDLTSKLVDIASGSSNSHFLIVGQRGMGKTSMLRRLALAAKVDTRLSETLIPLSFREEQYNVHSLQVFWTNCLDALGDWFDRIGEHVKAEQLDKDVAQIQGKPGAALILFNKWIAQEKKRPLLLLDNIDLIFSGLKKEPDALQTFIPNQGGIIVVGGAAATVEEVCDPAGKLHDAFNVIRLDRLSKDELIACLRSLALARGGDGEKVLQLLEKESARIRTLHDLTGGNPRTLTLLYMLLESDSNGDVFGDLERLLDQVTVLYKARVEDLPSQARVVLDAVALAWDPTLASEVSAATLLDVGTASSQLDRLQKEGIVEKVPVSKTIKSAYQISERFFNIWYLMRHGARRQRSRLRWLTVFLKSFYSDAQLVERAKSLVSSNGEPGADVGQYMLALSDAIDDEGWRSMLKNQARDEFERYAISLGRTLNEIVDPSDVPRPETAAEWVRHGNLLRQHLKRTKEAEKAFLSAISLEPSNWAAWYNLGAIRLSDLANATGAVEAFKEAYKCNSRHLLTNYMLGSALADVGEFEAAKSAYRGCLKLKPDFYLAAISLGDIYVEEGSLIAAAEQYRIAGSMAPKKDTEALHASGFFTAYILEDFERALKIYQRLLDIDPNDFVALSNQIVIKKVTDPKNAGIGYEDTFFSKHSKGGQALLLALEAIVRDDFASALTKIPSIFANEEEQMFETYRGFILLLLRAAARRGWGEQIIRVLDESGASDMNWPLRAGYNAFLLGGDRLLDVNPEVRPAASKILTFLTSPQKYRDDSEMRSHSGEAA
jgi:tetratricopeptide (TPR) repeat protein